MPIFENIYNNKSICEKIIEKGKSIGIEKLLVLARVNEVYELNVHANIIDLFRTTFSESVAITGFIGHKKGSIVINSLNLSDIEPQLAILKNLIESSFEDPANELAPFEGEGEFVSGNLEFSKEEMVFRLEEFIETSKRKYPLINFEEGLLEYSRGYKYLTTSNGTKFLDKSGNFSLSILFSSREREKVSSFNSVTYSKKEISKPIIEWENIDMLLKQNTEGINSKSIGDKFEGTLIFSPNGLSTMLEFLFESLGDIFLINGTSIYKDQLENKIASDILTIEANPFYELFVKNVPFTNDGFLTKPMNIIENGVLKSFLLTYYGSLKTGKPRGLNYGDGIIIKGKTLPLAEMIRQTKKGILVERLSGGIPSPNGDFSGVAKNSFFIEDGEIKYPVQETMINCNFASLLKSITAISEERVNDGHNILPYIKTEGAIISGK